MDPPDKLEVVEDVVQVLHVVDDLDEGAGHQRHVTAQSVVWKRSRRKKNLSLSFIAKRGVRKKRFMRAAKCISLSLSLSLSREGGLFVSLAQKNE